MKRLAQNLALVFGSMLTTMLLAEVLVRVVVPRERWEFRDASADWEPDSTLGWKQKRNYSTTNFDYGPQPVVFATNDDGFRPAGVHDSTVTSDDFVIWLTGNSTVNGRAVPENQTLHFYLDSLLKAEGRHVIVVNASVQGYSTDQALLTLARSARKYKPDLVLYGFCDNDLGGIMVSSAYGLNKPRFELRQGSLSLVPLQSFNTEMSVFRQSSWKDLVVKSALFRMIKPIIITMRSRKQDAANQILVGAHGADYYFDPDKLERYDWQLLAELLREMMQTSDSLGARFAFYSHPAVESVWKPHIDAAEKKSGRKIQPLALEKKLEEASGQAAVEFIPMALTFSANQQRGPFHLLPNDTHCNGSGYLLQAEVLRDFINRRLPQR